MTATSTSSATSTITNDVSQITGYLNAADAAALDAELMSTPGFSLEQLMELAGLSVAEAVYQVSMENGKDNADKHSRIVILCGPGNNGGDGLVAARHLWHFGFSDIVVVYPKPSRKEHFVNLVTQCENVGLIVQSDLPANLLENMDDNKRLVVIDAIFGFSFHGSPREPFASILATLIQLQKSFSNIMVISVDVPSGWNVDQGDVSDMGFVPDVLVSLTTPKRCSQTFTGRHFVGGRFLPDKIAEKYNIKMPPYPGTSQVMEIKRRETAEC